MKEKIKHAGFWVGLIGAVFLILGAFGVEIGDAAATTVVNAVCSLLVMLGIVVPEKPSEKEEQDKEENENQ